MDRRGFLAAGAASVAAAVGGCVALSAESRPPDFVFDDFETVVDVEVEETGTAFVGGTATDGTPRVVGLNEAGRAAWRFDADPLREDPHVVVGPEVLFVSQSSDPLLAVDRDTRSIAWRKADVRSSSFPVSAGVAYLSIGNRIVAAAVDDGRALWTHDLPPDGYLSPAAIVGETIVCTWGGGRITGLSVEDGSERWAHVLGGGLPPTSHRGGTVYSGTGTDADDPKAVAIDAASGEIRWTVRRTDGIVSPDVGPRNVYLPHDGAGLGTVAVDPETGEERWRRSGVAVSYAGRSGPVGRAGPGVVVALDPVTGEDLWRLETAAWGRAGPEIELAGSTVLVVDPDGMTAVDHESGRRLWRHRVSLSRHPRVEHGGSVAAVESDGTVLGFRLDR